MKTAQSFFQDLSQRYLFLPGLLASTPIRLWHPVLRPLRLLQPRHPRPPHLRRPGLRQRRADQRHATQNRRTALSSCRQRSEAQEAAKPEAEGR